MAPTSLHTKGRSVAAIQEDGKAATEALTGKRKYVMKSRTRKGDASRAHGLQKIVGRGLNAALKMCGIVGKGAKLGGIRNMVFGARAGATRMLLGVADGELTGRQHQTGLKIEYKKGEGELKIEYKKGEDGTQCTVSCNLSRTPKGCDGPDNGDGLFRLVKRK